MVSHVAQMPNFDHLEFNSFYLNVEDGICNKPTCAYILYIIINLITGLQEQSRLMHAQLNKLIRSRGQVSTLERERIPSQALKCSYSNNSYSLSHTCRILGSPLFFRHFRILQGTLSLTHMQDPQLAGIRSGLPHCRLLLPLNRHASS